MVTLAYNVVKIIVTTKITNSSKASNAWWVDGRVSEPSSIPDEEQRCAATVEEHVALAVI